MKRKAAVLLITAGGSIAVFGSVFLLNRIIVSHDELNTERHVVFTVEQQKQKIEPPRRMENRQKREPREDISLAPVPRFEGNLSDISVELPTFSTQAMQSLAESLLGDLDDVVMTEETVDEKPVPKQRAIVYPERAKQMKIEGEVVVSALIGIDGRIKKMKILESRPAGVFDNVVREMIPSWTFEPAKYKNRNVQLWVTIPIKFNLN